MTLSAIVIVVFEAAAVLALRAHYTMDVFTAVIAALYVAHLAQRLSPWLDQKLAGYVAPAGGQARRDGQAGCSSSFGE